MLADRGQLLIELALGCQVVEHDVRDARLALQGGVKSVTREESMPMEFSLGQGA